MDEISSIAKTVAVTLRPFSERQDEPFVYSTWRNSVYYGNPEMQTQNAKTVFRDLTLDIKRTLKRATVKVACLEDDPDFIIGYVVFTGSHLDWVYVKEDYRNMGIASLMVPKAIDSVTTRLTKIGKAILEKKQKENEHATQEEE